MTWLPIIMCSVEMSSLYGKFLISTCSLEMSSVV